VAALSLKWRARRSRRAPAGAADDGDTDAEIAAEIAGEIAGGDRAAVRAEELA
jgi:hypothetical protein